MVFPGDSKLNMLNMNLRKLGGYMMGQYQITLLKLSIMPVI